MSSSSSSSSDDSSSTSTTSSISSDSESSVGRKSVDHDTDLDKKLPAAQSTAPPRPFAFRKGSHAFPTSTTTGIFDRKRRHYHHLHKRGMKRVKKARAYRKQVRERMEKKDDNFDITQYPGLQSSSSEDSDEESNSDWEQDTVDFQALAHDSKWAKQPLFRLMPVSEISSLVGWATHQTHDGTNASDVGNNFEVDGAVDVEAANNESTVPQEAMNNDTTQREQANPLASLPNNPLPPSYLRYLAEKAQSFIEEPIQETNEEWKPHSFLTSADSWDEERPTKKRHTRKDWQQWDHDSEDETYQSLLQNKPVDHVTIHVPQRPKKKIKSSNNSETSSVAKNSRLYHSMDDSALVALGMVWEDMVTALLMPLARQHVARCRRLEQEKIASSGRSSNESQAEGSADPFQEWTLPPEQAIWRLAQEGVKSELPSALPPTRISSQYFDRESTVDEFLVNRMGSADQRQQQAVDNWCSTHELQLAFVRSNMDLYGTMLPVAPTVSTKREDTLREREDRYEALWRKRLKAKITTKTANVKKEDEKQGEKSEPPSKKDEISSEDDQRIEYVAV